MPTTAHDDPTAVAHALYDALATADPDALLTLLTEDFEGVVSDGMPLGVGGSHHGPVDMLGMWGTVDEAYDVRPEPDEFLAVSADKVVVIGRYRGHARAGDTAVDAAFAHVLDIRGQQIAGLHQITDTVRWEIPRAT